MVRKSCSVLRNGLKTSQKIGNLCRPNVRGLTRQVNNLRIIWHSLDTFTHPLDTHSHNIPMRHMQMAYQAVHRMHGPHKLLRTIRALVLLTVAQKMLLLDVLAKLDDRGKCHLAAGSTASVQLACIDRGARGRGLDAIRVVGRFTAFV